MTTSFLTRSPTDPDHPVRRRRSASWTSAAVLSLLADLPLGIAAFTGTVTLLAVGLGTVLFWVGLPVLAAGVLFARALARFERARAGVVLGVAVGTPERPVPAGSLRLRWRVRMTDPSTWRALAWSLLLALPLGIVEFTVTVTLWSVGLGLVGLPVFYRYLPSGAFVFPGSDGPLRWVVVDSVWSAAPWAVGGLLVLGGAVLVSQRLAAARARLALSVLGGRIVPDRHTWEAR